MNFLGKVAGTKRLIAEAIDKYGEKVCLTSSGGKDSNPLVHMGISVKPDIRVITVLADTEFPETYKFVDDMIALWGLNCTKVYFKQRPGEKCCGKPKVEAFRKALEPYDAWISGVRQNEGITRANFQPVEEVNGLVKFNPILYFTELDIWRYTALFGIPVNPLYRMGYRSLGCSLCSFPEVDENESEREGRWKGTPHARGECGIHTQPLRGPEESCILKNKK